MTPRKTVPLSKRLKEITKYIKSNQTVVDVGCDHGYLDIFLAKIKRDVVYAIDINRGPLDAAKRNIKQYGAQDRVFLIQKDGLGGYETRADIIVIAGLGGRNICKILLKEGLNFKSGASFIIEPQNNIPYLRDTLSGHGFKIKNESVVLEKGKYYIIITLLYDSEKRKLNLIQSELGDFKWLKESDGNKYLAHLEDKYKKILNGLNKSKTKDTQTEKYIKLLSEIQTVKRRENIG